jgi:lysophospholipase L1-like esterase
VPNEALLIATTNQVIAQVVGSFPSATVVDVFSTFDGRSGLLLVEKHRADQFQVHPTDAGYRVMAKAFADAIQGR